MNAFTDDYTFDEQPQPARKTPALVWNVLTVLVLISFACITTGFLIILINPYSALNPFPPTPFPAAIVLPSPTPTPRIILPPTWTPEPTEEPTATNTPRPTATLPPTNTPFSLVTPTLIPLTPSAKAQKSMPFVIDGKPVPIANIAHPEQGCNWMGIAGQVKDIRGSAVRGQQVQLGGALTGSAIPGDFMLTLTGLAPQYGPGYYEFTLADHPIASKGALWVQLLDQAGLSMSEKIYFDTYEDCEKNLIVLNFKQVR